MLVIVLSKSGDKMNDISVSKYDFDNIIEDPDKRLVLVIYDIVDNKRRNGMVKVLEGYGIRVQKSAFETLVTDQKYREMIKKIQNLITEQDNVRIYKLNSSNEVSIFGSSDTIYEEEVIIV